MSYRIWRSRSRQAVALLVCAAFVSLSFAEGSHISYKVKYSGGSLPSVKGGEELSLFINTDRVRLERNKNEALNIATSAITEVSYGQEVHRRIGTAAGVAVFTLGIGAIVAFSKSKKHYIGLTWADGENKGGIALQADKNEYRGLLAALEGVTGMKAIDTDQDAKNKNK